MIGRQAAIIPFWTVNDTKVAITWVNVSRNSILELEKFIKSLSAGKRKTGTKIPTCAEFPCLIFTKIVCCYEIDIVSSVKIGRVNLCAVISVYEPEWVRDPCIKIAPIVLGRKVNTISITCFRFVVRVREFGFIPVQVYELGKFLNVRLQVDGQIFIYIKWFRFQFL